jgi:hypothetical protein
LAMGLTHSCAVVGSGTDSTVKCWNRNEYGQFGDGAVNGSGVSTPVAVVGGVVGPAKVVAGQYSTCVDYGPGIYACWGMNENAMLGTGSGSWSQTTPEWVLGL